MVQKFMLVWVCTILSSKFYFKFENRNLNWGEGINTCTHTHIHFIPSKKDFWYIKVRRYNIFNLSLFYIIFCKQKYVSKLCLYCQFALFQVKLFFVTMVLDMQIENLIHFNSIKFIQYLTYFRPKVKLSHSTMVLGPTSVTTLAGEGINTHTHTHAHFITSKKVFWYIKVRRYNIFNFILVYYILSFVNKYMFQNFIYIVNLHHFRSNFFFVTMVLDMQIQFNSIIFCSILFYLIFKLFQYLNYFRSKFLYPPWS